MYFLAFYDMRNGDMRDCSYGAAFMARRGAARPPVILMVDIFARYLLFFYSQAASPYRRLSSSQLFFSEGAAWAAARVSMMRISLLL